MFYPDVPLLDDWHMNPHQISMPSIPTSVRARALEIERHRSVLSPEYLDDPAFVPDPVTRTSGSRPSTTSAARVCSLRILHCRPSLNSIRRYHQAKKKAFGSRRTPSRTMPPSSRRRTICLGAPLSRTRFGGGSASWQKPSSMHQHRSHGGCTCSRSRSTRRSRRSQPCLSGECP